MGQMGGWEVLVEEHACDMHGKPENQQSAKTAQKTLIWLPRAIKESIGGLRKDFVVPVQQTLYQKNGYDTRNTSKRGGSCSWLEVGVGEPTVHSACQTCTEYCTKNLHTSAECFWKKDIWSTIFLGLPFQIPHFIKFVIRGSPGFFLPISNAARFDAMKSAIQ